MWSVRCDGWKDGCDAPIRLSYLNLRGRFGIRVVTKGPSSITPEAGAPFMTKVSALTHHAGFCAWLDNASGVCCASRTACWETSTLVGGTAPGTLSPRCRAAAGVRRPPPSSLSAPAGRFWPFLADICGSSLKFAPGFLLRRFFLRTSS